jgi:hypothetical protein
MSPSSRWRASAIAGIAILTGSLLSQFSPTIANAAAGGAGASLPYVEIQAESTAVATNGTAIGPSFAQGQLAAEASGRKAVTLTGQGKYVEFTLTAPANSVVVRYSIPDTSGGAVYSAPLSLYVGGARQSDLSLTNAYSWYYGSYPFNNSPGSGSPMHFYDEVHRLLPQTYAAGTKVRLQVDANSSAASYTIDLADFELVAAPLTQPANSISVTSYGADASGVADSSSAFTQAIAASAGRTVWIPAGTFRVNQHIIVNNVTILGAGMWHSTVTGNGVGFYGNYAPSPSSNVHLSDFAIFGNVQERNDADQVNGLGGAMSNSSATRLWIEHTKVGAWMDGPFTGLSLDTLRIRNQTADAVNFHKGVTNSITRNSDIRNVGDDGLAMWSEQVPNANNTFSNNTVQLPILANGIAIYGGYDNFVTGNRVVDAGLNQGGGIHVAQRFASTQLGKTTVNNNTIIRSGDRDPNWQFGVGALWFDARDGTMSGDVQVSNLVILQSPYEAIQFVSGSNITNVKISDVRIEGTGTFVVQKQVAGSATFSNVVATGVGGPAAIYDCGVGFSIIDGGGNSGWSTTYCGPWPSPNFPPDSDNPPPPGPALGFSPGSITFAGTNVGATTASQTSTLTNTGTATATISSITKAGDFAQTNNCGASLAVNANCTVTVTFSPTTGGARTGSVTVANNGSAATLSLSGTGVDSSTNLALGKPAMASSGAAPYLASNATDGNTSSYWESNNNSFPQWVQVDLGTATSVNRVTLALPPTWGTRTQPLSVLGSTDGTSFSTLASSSAVFNPASNNLVTISFTASSQRFVRINITGNTGWPAGQLSELQVFGGGTPPPPAPVLGFAPASLAFGSVNVGSTSGAQSATLTNSGTATATISSIAKAGDFAQSNNCGASLAVNASCTVTVTFSPTTSGNRSGTVTINSNAMGSPTTLSLSGTGAVANSNLALGKPATASGSVSPYVGSNVTDGSTSTYWESTNNAFPQWIQVDLGAATSITKVTLRLPPATSWATRTQTLSVQASTNGSTYTTLVASAGYSFNPASANSVTITFPATSQRYLRLNFTGNTGWPAAQLAEFEIYQ